MTRLSSNWTLFFKIFLPTFWVVFFGALCLAVLLTDPETISLFSTSFSRIILVACYFIFFAFLYFTMMRLVRVDFDNDFLYITNYFKTYRYPFVSVESITREKYGLFSLVIIRFKAKTNFGISIYCLPSKVGIEEIEKTEIYSQN